MKFNCTLLQILGGLLNTIAFLILVGQFQTQAAKVYALNNSPSLYDSGGTGYSVSSGFPVAVAASDGGWRWCSDRGWETLPPLDATVRWVVPCAVSADGKTIVGYCSGALSPSGPPLRFACRWNDQLQPSAIGADDYSYAYGVSGDGSVIVGSTAYEYYYDRWWMTSNPRAFRWSSSGGLSLLPKVYSGGWEEATAVSLDGSHVGMNAYTAGTAPEGFSCMAMWSAGQVTKLVEGASTNISSPRSTGVSNDGQTFVGCYVLDPGTPQGIEEGLLWKGSTGFTFLPDFWVTGMSADGQIVVGGQSGGYFGAPAIWTPTTGYQSLSAYLTSKGYANGLDCMVMVGDGAVSPDGRWVFGMTGSTGSCVGTSWRAYLADLFTPTPANWATEALGAGVGNTSLAWTTTTNSPWVYQSYITQDGVSSLEAGAAGDWSPSVLQTTVTGPQTISFWWRTASLTNSGNPAAGTLVFSIGGVEQGRLFGGSGWRKAGFQIPAGRQTLSWTYTRMQPPTVLNTVLDSAWVGNVTLVDPAIVNQPTNTTALVDSTVSFSLTALGNSPLTYRWLKNSARLDDNVRISGTTAPTLLLRNVSPSDAGQYAAIVTDASGSVTSAVAVLTVTLSALLTNPPGAIPAPAGLVNWWTAEGNCVDIYGTNNGFPQSGLSYPVGKVGLAFGFDGATAFINLGAQSLPPPWTACMWVYRQDALGSSAALMSDGTYALKLEQYNGTRQVGLSQMSVADSTFGYTVPTNTWVHLAFVGTGSQTLLFANGVLQGTLNVSIPLPRGFMGVTSVSAGRVVDYMLGSMDEVMVFNRILTGGEINAIYAAGSAGLVRTAQFSSVSQSAGGQMMLNLVGQTDKTFTIYSSTNLLNWSVLCTLTNPAGIASFTDGTGAVKQKFYRASQP